MRYRRRKSGFMSQSQIAFKTQTDLQLTKTHTYRYKCTQDVTINLNAHPLLHE